MEEVTAPLHCVSTKNDLETDIEDVKKVLVSQEEQDEDKQKSEIHSDGVFRERKTSGYSIHEFISRNGWNVEKLPTFDHLHISELTHGVLDFQDKIHSEFVRQWRRVVTGDPNK